MNRRTLSRLLVALSLLAVSDNRLVADPPPDTTTPPFRALRERWTQEKTTLDGAHQRRLRELLETRRTTAEADYQEKLAARNVKGMSIARKARELCDEALETVRTNGTFDLPRSVRRELDDWLRSLATDQAEARAQHEAGLARQREATRTRFAELLAAQTGMPPPAPAELDALFDQFLTATPAPPPAKTPHEPPPSDGATAAPPEPEPESPWFAASGEATNWFTAGRWTADMMAQDLFSIPVIEVTGSYHAVKTHPFSDSATPFAYTVVTPLPADRLSDYRFRLKRLPDRAPVALLAWPSAANRGRLEFRTQPAPTIPMPHGFELEAARVQAEAPADGWVEARLDTRPAGAEIRIDGKRLTLPSGETARTPATLRLPPGPRTLSLRLDQHQPKTIDRWDPQRTPRVAWTFQHDTERRPTQIVKLDPSKGWTPAGVRIAIGDRIWLIPSGQWTIGRKAELCGPDGYPDTARFAHYYGGEAEDPRQTAQAPYGALLVRVGDWTEPTAVTNTLAMPAPAVGSLYLDVNEKLDKAWRKDNRGQMTVKVIVIPFEP